MATHDEEFPKPAAEAKFVALRCPGCLAQVNVQASHKFAKCQICRTRWAWRTHALRVAFTGRP